jgi:gliding motility-associated-like protein/uncharacterized repeat protein (TIGR01451 family)
MKKGYSKSTLNLLLIFTLVVVMLFQGKVYGAGSNVITIYKGQSVTLRVNVPGAVSYQWSKDGQAIAGATNNSYVVSVSGIYTVIAFNQDGCSSPASDAVEVKVIENVADLSIIKQSESKQVREEETFEYTLNVYNKGPLVATDVVAKDTLPAKLEYVSLQNVSAGSANFDPGNRTLTWQIGELGINNSAELSFLVKAINYGHITNTATISAKQDDPDLSNNTSSNTKTILGLDIPNVFTPNGDGLNDTFTIKDLPKYPENELLVFNRWGNSVFQEKNYHNEWTAQNLSEGTYFYILKIKSSAGIWEDYHGYLTLLRRK